MTRFSAISLLAATLACITGPEQHNRLCPCSDGWVCAEGRCVEEDLVCPGNCGDGVICPGEACDDGDSNNCTVECNATCSGPAEPHNPACVEPTIAFAVESFEMYDVLPPQESETYLLYAHSSNAYYQDVRVTFGTTNDLNEGKLNVTPATGWVSIPAGSTTSEPIGLEILRNAVSHPVRRVYVLLLTATPGEIGAPAVFTLAVRNRILPRVTRILPATGAVFVSVDTSIEVEFSVAMDPVVSGAAFVIDPVVDGEITWEQDDELLVFSPLASLDAQQSYVVTIGAEAASAEGVNLAEYTSSFETFGPLDVALIMTSLSGL